MAETYRIVEGMAYNDTIHGVVDIDVWFVKDGGWVHDKKAAVAQVPVQKYDPSPQNPRAICVAKRFVRFTARDAAIVHVLYQSNLPFRGIATRLSSADDELDENFPGIPVYRNAPIIVEAGPPAPHWAFSSYPWPRYVHHRIEWRLLSGFTVSELHLLLDPIRGKWVGLEGQRYIFQRSPFRVNDTGQVEISYHLANWTVVPGVPAGSVLNNDVAVPALGSLQNYHIAPPIDGEEPNIQAVGVEDFQPLSITLPGLE